VTGSEVEVAHLSLDAAGIATAALRADPFLQNSLQDALMEAFAQPGRE